MLVIVVEGDDFLGVDEKVVWSYECCSSINFRECVCMFCI